MQFEERHVEEKQEWLEEALRYADTVPILVEGNKVTVGFQGEEG